MTLVRSLAHLNPWIYLFTAGVCEIGFTSFMKLSNGIEHWIYNVCFAVCALLSFGLQGFAFGPGTLGTRG